MDAYNASANPKAISKKKDDNFTDEDSSIYAHGEEFTNAAGQSNRHDLNFDGIEQISDSDDNL